MLKGIVKTINMPPTIIPSSSESITKQISVIAKLNGRKYLAREVVFMIWYFPANNYLFKVSSLSTIIRCDSCSNEGSRTMWMTLFAVFIVKCEHVLHIVLIVDFEQLNVCRVHIKITNTFKIKIRYLMRYVAVFSVWKKFINKLDVNLYHRDPMDKSVRNSWAGVYFRRWLWLQRCGSHLNICIFTDFAHWKTN